MRDELRRVFICDGTGAGPLRPLPDMVPLRLRGRCQSRMSAQLFFTAWFQMAMKGV